MRSFLLGQLDQVLRPDFLLRQLCLERGEPVIVELDFSALDQLPGAGVVWAFLDRVVDVADWDFVRDFVVEDCLEGTYDLEICLC